MEIGRKNSRHVPTPTALKLHYDNKAQHWVTMRRVNLHLQATISPTVLSVHCTRQKQSANCLFVKKNRRENRPKPQLGTAILAEGEKIRTN